jgi:uncharacterized protein YjbI with pentapeptide repeats
MPCRFTVVMAEGNGTRTPTQEKPWTLRKFWGKPVWGWLQLLGVLAIPVVIAVGGCMFNAQQDARQLQLENQRAAAERELGERRAQDEALQAYLNQMGRLLLVRDLRNSEEEDSEVRTLARARALTVLDILGGERKRAVVTFLYEARLIEAPNPIVDISGADLQAAQLQSNPYVGVDLQGTYLNDGPDKDHRGALLYDCDLRDADLRDADLRAAKLDGATKLDSANLEGANLHGARGVTNEELEQQAASLEGATMPDGQLYEDWLKDKEG